MRKEIAMGKKTKRKDNKRHLRPPLTFLDKSIYFLCIVFFFLGALLLAVCFDDIQNMIAFNMPGTVAYRSNASFLFALPFMMFLEISALALFISGWESKKPIFGSKKYKYGEYPFKEDCFPLFSSQKRNQHKTPSQKTFVRHMTILWCSVLVVFSCLIPFSLFGRDAMYQDNRVEKINLINNVSDTYTTNDFSELTIQAKYVSGYRTADYWKYEIIIEMKDGKTFSFSNRDFDWRVSGSKDNCLDKMLEVKNLFNPDSITIKGANNIGEVSDFLGFDEQQEAKLKLLFAE